MSKKLVSELMVDYLERRDVKYVFGLCGHTVIGMLDALSRSEKLNTFPTVTRQWHQPQPTDMHESRIKRLLLCAIWGLDLQTY